MKIYCGRAKEPFPDYNIENHELLKKLKFCYLFNFKMLYISVYRFCTVVVRYSCLLTTTYEAANEMNLKETENLRVRKCIWYVLLSLFSSTVQKKEATLGCSCRKKPVFYFLRRGQRS